MRSLLFAILVLIYKIFLYIKAQVIDIWYQYIYIYIYIRCIAT